MKMFVQISLLLLVIWPAVASNENCELADELKPFDKSYNCTTNGLFPDENDETCTRYIVCARGLDSFTTLYLTCPIGTNFNPEIKDCTFNYTCTYSSTTEILEEATTIEVITSTSVSSVCTYNSDPDYFRCSSSGSFANNNDLTCQSYFFCIDLHSFTKILLQVKYFCTQNSYFNPYVGACQTDYICPCSSSNHTSTTEIITTASPITTQTNTEKSVISTISTISTNTTSSNDCVHNPNPNYFNCSIKGRFRNDNDITCQSYYLCSVLSSGNINQTKYSCPPNSYFNPSKQLCDIDYSCPCSMTTKNNVPTTTSEHPDLSNITDEIMTEVSILSSTITAEEYYSITTEIMNSTYSDYCIYNSDPGYFNCTVKGRFRNDNDRSCKTYYLCSVLSSGKTIQTKYSCPQNSNFNPSKELCDVDYKCPCDTPTTTTTAIASSESSRQTPITELTTEETIFQDNTTVSSEEYTSHSTRASTSEETTRDISSTTESQSTSVSTTSEKITPTTESTTNETPTTNSGNECVYNSNPNYFNCTVKGRFRNANDKTCQSYYLCSVLSSGRTIQTKYNCPQNSYFNPSKELCDIDYKCPCEIPTTTPTPTPTTTVSRQTSTTQVTTKEASEETTQDIASTTDIESTSVSTTSDKITPTTDSTTNETPTTNSGNECLYNSDPNYFNCTVKGRFRNNNDKTCQTYYLCNILSSGKVIQTKYNCPQNSYFNPSKQLCDVDYKCPCDSSSTTTTTSREPSKQTTTTQLTTEETISQDNTTESSEESTSHSTTASTSEESTRDISSSTESQSTSVSTTSEKITPTTESTTNETPTTNSGNECVYNSNRNYFNCTVKGRFRNANDKTCQSYYLCSVLSSERTIQTKYNCPQNSYFNPSKELCDIDYKCPCEIPTTPTPTPTTTTITSRQTSTTQATTKEASEETTQAIASTTDIESSSVSTTSEKITPTMDSNTNETPTTNSGNECLYNSDPNYFNCTVKGRFRNNNDKTCQTYYLCNILSSGKVIQTKYNCPQNSNFNPSKQLCDVDYKCPCDASSTTTTTSREPSRQTTTTELTTEETISQDNTTKSSKESTSHSTTASLSEETTRDISSTTERQSTSVPTTSEKITPTTESTASEAPTTNSGDECIYNSNPNYFNCTVKGRLRNANDKTCQSYYLCSVLSSGKINQTKYSCPPNSYFNPSKQLCDIDYSCPCSMTTKNNVPTTTSEHPDLSNITDEIMTEVSILSSTITAEEYYSITTEIMNSTYSDYCIYNSDPGYFNCTVKGRFRNDNDRSCKTYYLCSVLSSGKTIQTKYSCPQNSNFNPSKELCDVDYKCPCDTPTTTTTAIASSESSRQTPITELTTEETIFQDNTTVSSEEYTSHSTRASTSEETTRDISSTTESQNTSVSTTSEKITPTTESTTNETPTTNSGNECVYNSNPNYFNCTVKGRFRNANDKTCQSYYLCSVLSSGRTIQTKYNCPQNSYFNPSKELCDIDYKCPCEIPTTTTTPTPTPTTTTITSRQTSTTQATTKEASEETTQAIASTTDIESSSVSTTSEKITPTMDSTTNETPTTNSGNECLYNSDPNYFNCTVKGRFRNNNDKTCQTYYLCNILSSGKVIQTKYNCPQNSYFNPSKQLCDVDYKCPCDTSSTTTKTSREPSRQTTTTELTTEETISQDNTTESSNESTSHSTTASLSEETTRDISSTAEGQSTSVSTTSEKITPTTENTASETLTTNSGNECIYNSNPNYFNCTVKGRFRNANDKTCQSYYLCSVLSSGRTIQTKYNCPQNSYFNPSKELCDIDYKCPCEIPTTTPTPTPSTTISRQTSTTQVTTKEASKETTQDIASTTDIESTSVSTTSEKITPTTESTTNETPTTKSGDECIYNSNPNYFNCTVKGRFRNANDKTCQSYYLCSVLSSGRTIQTKYNCPQNSYFNPSKELCDVDYKCPCSAATTLSTTTGNPEGETSLSTTEPSLSTSHTVDELSTVNSTVTFTTISPKENMTVTTTEMCSYYNSDPNYFVCTTKGRFKNDNDLNCGSYYLCSQLRSGRFLKTKYICPTNSYFNPTRQLCDMDYKCGCKI